MRVDRTQEDQIRELEGVLCDAGCNERIAGEVAAGLVQEAEVRERNRVMGIVQTLINAQMLVLTEQVKNTDAEFFVSCSLTHLTNGLQEIKQFGKKF